MNSKRLFAGVCSVVISALGFGLIPVFALYAYRARITVATLLFCRFTLATLIFALFHLARGKPLRVARKRDAAWLLVLGSCYAAQACCYFLAIKSLRPSFAVLLFYVFPILVALLSWAIDRERTSGTVLLSMAAAGAGLLLILGTSYGAVSIRGVLLAFASAAGYAAYLFFGHRTLARMEPLTLVTYSAAFSSLAFLGFGAVAGGISFSFHPEAWIYICLLAVFSTVVGIGLLFRGAQILGPTRTSVLGATEPVFGILAAAALLGDRLAPVQVAGAGLVLLSVLIVSAGSLTGKAEPGAQTAVDSPRGASPR